MTICHIILSKLVKTTFFFQLAHFWPVTGYKDKQ